MTKSEFEHIAKQIISNSLYLVPEGESIRIYKGKNNYHSVELGRFEYSDYGDGDIRITIPAGTEE